MTLQSSAGLSLANIFSFLPVKREIMTQNMIDGLSGAAVFQWDLISPRRGAFVSPWPRATQPLPHEVTFC